MTKGTKVTTSFGQNNSLGVFVFMQIGKHVTIVAKHIASKEHDLFLGTDLVYPDQFLFFTARGTNYIKGMEELLRFLL